MGWTLRKRHALCGIPFGKAKQRLQIAFVCRRPYVDVEGGSVSCQLRANHTGQPLHGGAQVFGMDLLQFNRDGDVEQRSFSFLRVLCPVGKQTAPEYPSQADERVALARGAFVTSTAGDDLAIQAEHCFPERERSCVERVRCSGEHRHQPVSLRCEQRHSTRIQRHSQCVICQELQC